MQVTCPNCGARYAVDPLAIGPIGRTVQCARCSHRWRETAAAAPVVATEPPAVPPRPAPDFAIRPPVYNSGLPALRTPPPPQAAWGRWLSAAMIVIVVLGIAAYAWRGEIRDRLPPGWQAALDGDGLRGLVKK